MDLPYLDVEADSEVGVLLLGLDSERLLMGLGLAVMTAAPEDVALLTDKLTHHGRVTISAEDARARGKQAWRAAYKLLVAAGRGERRSGSPREAWAGAVATVSAVLGSPADPASCAYVAACWYRREEMVRSLDVQ